MTPYKYYQTDPMVTFYYILRLLRGELQLLVVVLYGQIFKSPYGQSSLGCVCCCDSHSLIKTSRAKVLMVQEAQWNTELTISKTRCWYGVAQTTTFMAFLRVLQLPKQRRYIGDATTWPDSLSVKTFKDKTAQTQQQQTLSNWKYSSYKSGYYIPQSILCLGFG